MAELILQNFQESARQLNALEVAGVLTGIGYVVLAARESIWCWPFGLVSSLLSILLFYRVGLLAEAGLYVYYVAAAVYGWWSWRKPPLPKGRKLSIQKWPVHVHILGIAGVTLTGLMLGWMLEHYTAAAYPWIDSQTTVFSFWATYLTTRKVLENWVYWIVIDLVSVGLYAGREVYLYAFLMVLYTGMAAWGFFTWKRTLKKDPFI